MFVVGGESLIDLISEPVGSDGMSPSASNRSRRSTSMSSPPLPCTPSRSRDRVRITMRVIVSASASKVNPCSTDHPRTMNAEIPRHTAYEALTTANQPGVRNNPARTTSGAYMDQATLRGQATMQASLATGIPEGMHEYLLYLPLYNGVSSVHIGVNPDAVLAAPPERPETTRRPVLFWGTSITQGGCASRPGMAYPAIVGRMMDRPTINLGFSGNGQMEPEMAAFIAEIDAEVFVLDCCPNLGPEEIAARTEPVVRTLRDAHPDTPIVLMENIIYQKGYFLPAARESYEAKNAELKAAYERLVAAGVTNLHYIPCDTLLGDDAEATVDGTHATDLGFLRMAQAITPVLNSLARK